MGKFESLIENNLLIERCTVFKWYEYLFETGETRDKFWITLNCKINDFPINVILPTSQYNSPYYSQENNLTDCIIIEKGESTYFYADKTILDLHNIQKEDEYKIREAYEDEFLIKCGPLEEVIVNRIEETIRLSTTLDYYLVEELLCLRK